MRKLVPSWINSSETEKENYRFELENRLNNIHIPDIVSDCRNVLCDQHNDDLNDYCETVLDAIELAAKDQLESTKVKDKENSAMRIIPGWNEYVKPFHEEAKFWWSIWISSGRPSGCNNSLFQNMKSSKAQYKYAIRRLKSSAEQVHNNAFVSSILGGSSSIYSEVKKFRGMTKTVSSRIDDVVGSEKIANHFAEKYSDLYNKCELGADFENLSRLINNNISNDDMEDIDAINPELIREALKKMKSGKNDVLFEFNSDCMLNAPDILHTHLANLFRMFLVHGKVAHILLLCSLIPIVKDNLGDITSSDNYRAIAKSSLILRLFDWIVNKS